MNEPTHLVDAPHKTMANQQNAAEQRPFRIVHISDPHLSRQYYREHIKSFKILLRSIVDEGFDHLVITGDMVSTADPDDYYLAREILSSFSLLDPSKLTIIPGNHDVFGGPHRATDVLSFPQHIRSIDYRRGLSLFEEAFAETLIGVRKLAPGRTFPFLKQVGPVNIVGLNSIPPWSLRKNILGTNGALDDAQWNGLDAVSKELQQHPNVTIAALHHHFNDLQDAAPSNDVWRKIESRTMRMRKRRRLLRQFADMGVQLVMHGHIHRNEVYTHNGITFANGAGSICDDPIRFLKYNAITVDGRNITAEIRTLPIPYQASSMTRSFHTFRTVQNPPELASA